MTKITQHLALLLFLLLHSASASMTDLEQEFDGDFVLQTQQIEIPGFEGAFNPSILRFQGSLLLSFRTSSCGAESGDEHFLLCFRVRQPLYKGFVNEIGLVLLNDALQLVSQPQILHIPRPDPHLAFRQQDPRLIAINDRVYIVYSNIIEGLHTPEVRRMFVAELHYDGCCFYTDAPVCIKEFEGMEESRWQKNWVPFEYAGKMLLAYSILPHKIFLPSLDDGVCQTLACSKSDIDWDWGVLRGGTPALRVDGQYLAFFHSSKEIATKQSQGKKMSHYVMGAYTFQDEPPFAVTAISPRPIIGKKFYEPPYHQTWKPLRVVFPCGFVFDEKRIWVAYGRQDHEIWIATLDKQKLLQSLKEVSCLP